MDPHARIGAAIRLLKKTNMQVARECRKSCSHISGIIKGKRKPSPEILTWLAENNIDLNWIFTGEGRPHVALTVTEVEPPYETAE